jgi:branched-chain amino acid transport system ATP-binding protein
MAPDSTADLLVVEDLRVAYGRIRAVDGISMRVPASGCTAILGPNGAGKTTLLRGITGLARPESGHVVYDGTDITRMRPSRIARLGVAHVQQGRGIFPRLTVDDNIKAVVARLVDPDIGAVLNYFPRLAERGGQVAGTLSGGEQQMLALSLALLSRPRLLVIDEPSLGLAPQVVREIYSVFGELRAAGTSLVIVEQFVHMLLGVADHVYLLQKGRIAFSGSADELARGAEGGGEIMGMYLGAERARGGGPAGGPAVPAVPVAEPEPQDRLGRALLLLRRLEVQADVTGETVDSLVARVVDTDGQAADAGPMVADEVASYTRTEGAWAVCTMCDHQFRPILLLEDRCPRCHAVFAEDIAADQRGPLARWWSERLRNPSFVLLVVLVVAFSQLVLLAALLQVGD